MGASGSIPGPPAPEVAPSSGPLLLLLLLLLIIKILMMVEAVLFHTLMFPNVGNILEKTVVIIRVRIWTGHILKGLKVDVETAIFKCI